ncbi:MAG: hypothetical protein PVJ39_10795 [Gammaproteobacteria bacterium]|jgi:hypothetical protein
MESELLKVPKVPRSVTFWVHPEGRVTGSIFLRKQSMHHAGEETPLEALNHPEPFIVLRRQDPDQLRFYNRKSLIRVEYEGKDYDVATAIKPLSCQLFMMDGSVISGNIQEPLHPNRARLLDYLNKTEDQFIKLHVDRNTVLVNKSYIIHVFIDNLEDSD